MSKIFNDPTYEEMVNSEDGWLNLAIEPFEFRVNTVLSQMPDEIDVSIEEIFSGLHQNLYGGICIYKHKLISEAMKKLLDTELVDQITRGESRLLTDYFDIRLSDDNIVADLVNNTFSGSIKLVKTSSRIIDEDVYKIVSDIAKSNVSIGTYAWGDKRPIVKRMSEVMELLGCKKHCKSTSISKKEYEIRKRLGEIILNDEWRMRRDSLIYQIPTWITKYCCDGNQHAFMNLTRLKCMTHKGRPIYSMEEIV